MDNPQLSFWARHEFFIRRLHSLTGLIPVGAFMCVHLMANASVLSGPGVFQRNVIYIHLLDALLPLVEWVFIYLPILFHGIIGVVIISGGLPNNPSYPYMQNWRYAAQRATGMLAFVYIFLHVFHMHGWLHNGDWLEFIEPLGGHQFRPFNAASTAGLALQSTTWMVIYLVGVLSCVFHLANGIWTMGITWGVWTSPRGQARATVLCGVFGLALAGVAVGALFGMHQQGRGEALEKAIAVENKIYQNMIETGQLRPNEHKRSHEQTEAAEE